MWVELHADSGLGESIGRAMVSVTALDALRAVREEEETAPPPAAPPPMPLPDGAERWRLDVCVAGAVLKQQVESVTWLALHLTVNHTTVHSRAVKASPPPSKFDAFAPLQLPLQLERQIFVGPGTHLFPSLGAPSDASVT